LLTTSAARLMTTSTLKMTMLQKPRRLRLKRSQARREGERDTGAAEAAGVAAAVL